MNIIRFDRHELFNQDWMNYHSETLRRVENFYIDQDASWFNEVYNQLCGIWDGYLYTDVLQSALQIGIPPQILQRIANTIRFIESTQK